MKTKWIFLNIFLSSLTLGVIPGCNKSIVQPESVPITLPDNGNQVIQAQNQFAIKLFKESLAADHSSSNKLISPISVYLDLSMVYNGAAGTTETGMQNTLQLSNINTGLLNSTNQILIAGLPKEDPKVQLNIANSIWYKNSGIQPLSSFLDMTSKYYQAEVEGSDFSQATVNQINSWVSNATSQKIPSIIQQIDPDDIMYLINAVYFKGTWKYSFNSNKTQKRSFYTSENQQVQSPFMYQEGAFNYLQTDSAQMIELPYGTGDYNMYVVLPNEGISLQNIVSSLSENTLTAFSSSLRPQNVRLYLPKWKYSYEISNMIPELTNMGMGTAFTPGADFSNMYPTHSDIYISKVIHKTYIAVDEQGTEAAAATAIGITFQAVSTIPSVPVMDVNHPFLYVITEKNTGAILFIGEVNNPVESSH